MTEIRTDESPNLKSIGCAEQNKKAQGEAHQVK